MNKLVFVMVVVLLALCCEKEAVWLFDEIWEGPQEYGNVHALRNGEIWEASASLRLRKDKPNFFEIGFLAYSEKDSILAESMGLHIIPLEKGIYTVHHTIGLIGTWKDSTGGIYLLRNDDVPRATYFPDANRSNRLWIDDIDTLSGTISGRFDLFFKKDTADKVTKYPSLIHFEKGEFKARFRP